MSTEFNEAFGKAQAAMPPITKNKTAKIETRGGGFEYSYADLPTILEIVVPVLEKHDLSVSQSVVSEGDRVGVETRIYHTSGHTETFGPLYLNGGSDARQAGSAITYARRYSLCAALGIAADTDDDGAEASRPKAERPRIDPGKWLADHVAVFGNWTEDQRRETAGQVMSELGYQNPMTQPQVEEVFDKMKAIYVETTDGDKAPF